MSLGRYVKSRVNRRQFLGSSACNAAGVADGMVGLGTVAATDANSRVNVGVIGCRGIGGGRLYDADEIVQISAGSRATDDGAADGCGCGQK